MFCCEFDFGYSQRKKDFNRLEERARVFANMKTLSCSAKERAQLLEIAQQAAFGLVQEAANAKQDDESVAKAYLDYFNRYRSSSLGDKALYYAAMAYEKAERAAEAEKVKLRLIKRFPQSELARETLFAMAAKHENAVEIKKSRKLFQHFAKLYVKDERTPLALLKVAKFSMALGDVAQAQTAYRKVGADYVEHPQAHLAAIQACEPLEKEIKSYREDGFNPPKRRAELLDRATRVGYHKGLSHSKC